ncbi:MAG TPA: argininosuccinate lyase [Syntrophorhabdaceae bacterium]|nr:argininosuccinate lyase [Syntrophorhabdaceae bacterium]
MKLWGGRFKDKTDPSMERFSASIHFDWLLFRQDIEGSKAHAEMLQKIGILTKEERDAIITSLEKIREDIEKGEFIFSEGLEDIHMHIESRLIEMTGDVGRKLHTGRSRNDQVSLDMRMFVKESLTHIEQNILDLLRIIIDRAEKDKDAIMPGYTHLQRAQVVTFSHYIMAYYFMLKRDRERIKYVIKNMDVLPLGSGAIAGSTIPLDREYVKERLGFNDISANSMDAVSDRDFCLDAVYSVAMIMLHLSRLSEDLIIFSTEEFSFVSLPDSLCTGSSLMPHKKNPDSLELVRGKTARVIGDLFSLFTLLKGLPMTYNRDMQEDKEPLFHALDTVKEALIIIGQCIKDLMINRRRMADAVFNSYMPAVEMTEYLVLKGIPFRDAHAIVGRMVKECENKNIPLYKMSLEEMRQFSLVFSQDVYDYIEPVNILKNRKTKGAASFDEVERLIEREKGYLNSL